MHSPGTLKVSNMISAAISLFSGGFRGGSVRMKLWSSLSTLRYLDAKLDLSSTGLVELQQSPHICHLGKEDIILCVAGVVLHLIAVQSKLVKNGLERVI